MQPIPMPKGLRGRSQTPKQKEALINCFYEGGDVPTIMTRPTVRKVKAGLGRCRGRGMFKDELYQVSNDRLIKITVIDQTKAIEDSNLTVTDIGEIAGSANCQLEAGFTALAIMVVGGALYVYDSVNGLREVTDALYMASVSMTYDAGRWVFEPTTGEPFFWSELNNPASILPTSFADAEEFPDLNKAVKAKKKQLYVLGSRSIERLQYQPNIDTYSVIPGATSSVGYVGGMVDFAETFLFLGQGVNGGFGFYAMGQEAEPLANVYVDEILSGYALNDLANIRGDSFKWEGTEFALFFLPNHTLMFNGDWALWHSGISGDELSTWTPAFFQFAYGSIFTGDSLNNKIGIITNDDKEYDADIECELLTFIRTLPRSLAIISRVFLGVNSGSSNEQTVGLAVSRDGVIFGNMIYRTIGKLYDYTRELSWGSPIIKISDHVSLKFRWSGQVRLNCDGLNFE